MRNMTHPSTFFAIATLLPSAILGLAAVRGGLWIVLAVMLQTIGVGLLDRLVQRVSPSSAFSADSALSATLGLLHFGLLALAVQGLAGAGFGTAEKLGLFFAAGLYFGQISNANAHELIHRTTRPMHLLGMWVYISLLFGHHTSAHVLVHHRYVATDADPNTSRKGEGFYRYALRAWTGSFKAGFRAEAVRRPLRRNPYLLYVGGACLFIAIAFAFFGWAGALGYLGLAGYAQMQLLMSDYVQHYGLVRRITAQGKPVPVTAAHSWNSPHWYSSAMMLNATRHSDHHAHPARPYPALTLPDDAPMLPKPLPLMASIALIPPLWRRIMDPQVERIIHA